MAVSELHSRLEHLVSYSSQLIFVSGDTIGEQQQSLQAFMGQQSETAEIAFINAKVDTYEQQYRRQISRQLLGDESGLFNRPLNELLSSLNHYDGPVLICICQAELLPPSFLQELWDLVLQCRFANNKQHLNVILFGKSAWAEQAKAWLPAKNRDKPVLLSNESITQSMQPDSALDKLIASKRKKFEERMIARAQPNVMLPNTLNNWWFRGILGLAFLATFCGLLLWQYSDAIPDIWSQPQEPVTPAITASDSVEAPPVELESAVEIVDAPADNNAVDMFSDQSLVTDWKTEVSEIRTQEDTVATSSVAATSDTANETSEMPVAQPELAQATPAIETLDQETKTGDSIAEPASIETSEQEQTDDMGNDIVDDYQVEDIVSVSQLPGQSEAEATQEVTAEDTIAVTDIDQINDLANTDYIIQIAGISSQQVVDEFVEDNNLGELVWIYTTQRFGGDWHVILQRQSYPSLEAARQALPGLPDNMQTGTPFVKSVNQVKVEITRP